MRAHWLTDPIMVEDGDVEGYTSSTYGDAFADVYDRWYHDLDDVPAAVAALAALTPPGGHVLELGVGTGRLAIPLAIALDARAATVTGIDSSGPMLERLAANDAGALVRMVRGDMVDALPDEPIDVALLAYNTLFNLLERGASGGLPGGDRRSSVTFRHRRDRGVRARRRQCTAASRRRPALDDVGRGGAQRVTCHT